MNWNDSKRVNEITGYLALMAVPGVGPAALAKLIKGFASADSACKQSVSAYVEIAGISRALASTVSEKLDLERASRMVEKIHQLNWGVMLDTDVGYPGSLLEISSRPPILFYLGSYTDEDLTAIAIVGSRLATESGREFANKISAELAGDGITIVSGLAHGIDRAAHKGALSASGRTIAVLGSGLDYNFSPADRKQVDAIAESGVVFSEFTIGTPTLPENFPRRNRIISGLSQGVIVVEAALRSGALLTARNALDQNRELFAVPGFPDRRQSQGANELIKQGAALLTSAEDLYRQLPRLRRGVSARKVKSFEKLTPVEERIVEKVTEGPMQIDVLSSQLGLSVSETLPTLLALELRGVVRELSGKRFSLNE